MVLINIKNDLGNYYTNKDGEKLLDIIVDNFKKGNVVEISFQDIDSINSSFVNSAFVSLLDLYSFDLIRKNLSFVNTNKQINSLIINRFKFELEKKRNKEQIFTNA
ncbi:STAS-like domain-containing protein [Melissococcus plutonius]|uniref:STAS-like domain-containing protein n=3 Tax=Melissococcus plutonius TaxID=33970 RepID=UPI0021E5C1FB|nr:STAS-like domain-containing protein [Melissococcus plutonius]MCV2499651.1 STAS-like domain-containing protein [Melissococcus plutonius]MCV2501892.1 STAS-like domain-containing protein [Melissococcus plutonius]MCV2506009.1 STAS-like domain-containing protein [Melissococcus plutonius]MCV2508259.1 STAS-like domain-containing protein [Melissococcus plutonius]MCV2527321.1 STAS-like domain-containing protein [Melissococcus plutonius]